MNLITISEEKCKKDGFCALECPMHIIRMPDSGHFPEAVEHADELCINCGHCLSVCPHGALTLKQTAPQDCAPLQKQLMPSAEQSVHFLKTRRSARMFKDKPVDRALIEQCIDAARYAPSGHNNEPVHWLVIHDPALTKRLSGIVCDWMRMLVENKMPIAQTLHLDLVVSKWDNGTDCILRGAPHIVVAHADKADITAQSAATIALTYLELAAHGLGLAATWAGFFHAAAAMFPPLVQELALPENHQCFGAMMIGLPKIKYHRIPPRKQARITWK